MVTDLISCGNGVCHEARRIPFGNGISCGNDFGTQPVPIFREIRRIGRMVTDLISCGNGGCHGLHGLARINTLDFCGNGGCHGYFDKLSIRISTD